MPHLLTSLGSGVVLILVSFVLLYKVTAFSGKKSALITALIVFGLYVPYAIVFWPGGDVFSIHLAIFGVVPYMLGIITSYREQHQTDDERQSWFHWAPALFVVFFLIVITVNVIMVTMAEKGMSSELLQWLFPKQTEQELTTGFPGVISHDYQEKEQLYNEYLAQLEKQKQRGWQFKHGWLTPPVKDQPAVFQIEAMDRNGHTLDGLSITVELLRPSNFREDREFELEEVSPGVYQQQVALPSHGNWDVLIHIHKGDDLHEIRGDTFVKASGA